MTETTRTYRWAERAATTVASANPATVKSNAIQLGGGYGFPDELPDIVAEAIAAAKDRAEGLQYGPLYGLDDLRDEIVRYLRQDGIVATRDNILVVNGAKHGLDLACRVFLEPGDAVIVTAPTYLTAALILKAAEATFLSVGQDGSGIDTAELEQKLAQRAAANEPMPKLLFDVPDFHNPTGITMSAERRKRLVELAEQYGFVIVEDDPYRRIRFEGEPVPPIKSFDTTGCVIGLGTVSKILAPGLRIGWVNAAPEIVRRMAAHKSDHGTCPLLQRIVVQLFQNGKVDHHIASLSKILRGHRDAMVKAIHRYLPGAKVRVPQGGYFLWVELPQDVDADELVKRAARAGVAIFSGNLSFAENAPGNFLRLAYSYSPPDRIVRGVELVGRAYEQLLAEADIAPAQIAPRVA
ncbi:MAG: PLP-dependent aminotransferase family protein [Alphaproteobacteria bacterium]|nr:PLP-dependent aminotransferase family protein [Alphaproteobacteria bacterium]